MFIESLKRDIEILTKTREMTTKISGEFLKDVIVVDGQPTSIPAINSVLAENITIKLLCGLSDIEFNNLTDTEFETLKQEIAKKK